MTYEGERWALQPRRTKDSDFVYTLPGGIPDDNDLWVKREKDEVGADVIRSTWELTEEQRQVIADGGTIDLLVWGGQPPVALAVGPPMEERKRG